EFLPQRAMLLGIPIGLFIIIYLEKYLRQRHISAIWKDVFFGALYGTLPFVHLHSFVAVSLVIGTYGVLCIRSWRTTLNFVFASSLPIIAWWYFFYRTSTNNSPIEFIKGWYIQDSWLEIAKFWFMNLGIFLPLALFGTILNGNFRNPSIISGWLLFLFGNFVKLQPWIWDNMKLFTWSFILIVPTVVDSMEYIANLFDKRISRIGSTFVLMLLLTISGFAEVSRIFWEKNTNLQMFSSEDLALAEEFRSFSKPTDLVLTSDKHNHWVSAVAGRRLVMGFKGWLWSYGLDYSNTERDVKAIFEGRDAGHELVKRYGIKFIVVGPSEHQNFKINNDYFKNNYPVALSKVDTTIYRIE
ncbi:MAG: hypothetical protein NT027_17900, partial [Proteobacteria bacterium]|nr:hypothetical protein [Pseudomonadota bacterium]